MNTYMRGANTKHVKQKPLYDIKKQEMLSFLREETTSSCMNKIYVVSALPCLMSTKK